MELLMLRPLPNHGGPVMWHAATAAGALPRSQGRQIAVPHTIHNVGIAQHVGRCSDAIETSAGLRWLVTSGTPGQDPDGGVPADTAGQAELAWTHIVTMLERAGMTVHDIVKVTQYLLRASDIAAYAAVRTRFLGDARPASMLLVVPALVRPDLLVEVEVTAAKA
jgi:2-iminobutanoate/2-iminopropanoate deaminase